MTDSDTRLQMKKLIKAKRQTVYEAWVQPEMIQKWIAPGTLKVPSAKVELKVGGAYKIEMEGDMRGQHFEGVVIGTYKNIIPNELLCFTWQWQEKDMRDRVGDTLVTVEFKDVDDGTEVTLTHERFATAAGRDGHQSGWTDSLEKLTKIMTV